MWWSILEFIIGIALFIGEFIQTYGVIILCTATVLLVFWSTQDYTSNEKTLKNYGKRLLHTIVTIVAMVALVTIVVLGLRLIAELIVDWVLPRPNFTPRPKQDDTSSTLADLIEYILRYLNATS